MGIKIDNRGAGRAAAVAFLTELADLMLKHGIDYDGFYICENEVCIDNLNRTKEDGFYISGIENLGPKELIKELKELIKELKELKEGI